MATDPTPTPPATQEMGDATAPAAGLELDGENQAALVGVMTSERAWVVAPWIKAVSFWVALASIAGLVAVEVHKRLRFRELIVDSVVEPEWWGVVGQPPADAPDFTLPAGDGGAPQALSAYRGKWVFVNFWATWCPPCRDEMPSIEMLNRRMKDKGLVMMAVSVDEDWKEVNRFFGDTKPTFQVLWDREKRATSSYGTNKFPESYLIDPSGKVVAKFTGPRDWYNQGTVQYFDDVLAGRRKPVS